VAVISFLIDTTLYVAFDLTQKDYIIGFSLVYAVLAVVIQLAVLLNLVVLWATQHRHRTFFLVRIGIVLALIPIAGLYLYFLNFHKYFLHF
jgi:hypothetical protein